MFLFLFFMENDFSKPTHPTKVWKIPYFFFEGFPNMKVSFYFSINTLLKKKMLMEVVAVRRKVFQPETIGYSN